MPRLYLQLQVDFDDDEKVARLARYTRPGEARACRDLLVAMWRYIKRERTDGHVPAEIVGRLVYPDSPRIGLRDADRLVEVGLAERTDTGYYLGGYLKHNKSRAQIEEESKRKAEAGAKGGKASSVTRNGEANGKHPAYQPANQDAEQLAKPARSQSTENREQRTENTSLLTLGGNVTQADARENAPPDNEDDQDPEPVCPRHRHGNPDDQPCNGCAEVRRLHAAWERRQRRRAATLRANCPDCHGTGWTEHDDGTPAGHCTHHRSTA